MTLLKYWNADSLSVCFLLYLPPHPDTLLTPSHTLPPALMARAHRPAGAFGAPAVAPAFGAPAASTFGAPSGGLFGAAMPAAAPTGFSFGGLPSLFAAPSLGARLTAFGP